MLDVWKSSQYNLFFNKLVTVVEIALRSNIKIWKWWTKILILYDFIYVASLISVVNEMRSREIESISNESIHKVVTLLYRKLNCDTTCWLFCFLQTSLWELWRTRFTSSIRWKYPQRSSPINIIYGVGNIIKARAEPSSKTRLYIKYHGIMEAIS